MRLSALTLLLVTLCVACSKDEATQSDRLITTGDFPYTAAWLSERLPENTLAYVRVPTIFNLVSAPKSNELGEFLGSTEHVDVFNELLAGLDENIVRNPGLDFASVAWFLKHQRSPIEIGIGPVIGSQMQTPVMTLTVATDFTSRDDMQTAFSRLLGEMESGITLADFDDAGVASLSGLPMPAQLAFDEDTRRLFILAGPGATTERMQTTVTGLAEVSETSPIKTLERRIDGSGHGLFMWISARQAMTMAQMFIPPEIAETIRELSLADAEAVAMGYGVSQGKTRVSLLADIPSTGDGGRGLIPVADLKLDLGVTAAPRSVFVMNLPSVDELMALVTETPLGESIEADGESVDELLGKLNDLVGTDVLALYGALDHTFAYVSDPVGAYVGVRVTDPEAIVDGLSAIGEKNSSPLTAREIAGRTYYHFRWPSALEMVPDEDREAMAIDEGVESLGVFLDIYSRLGTHTFFAFDGDYMLFAAAPQTLMDRFRRGTPIGLDEWLAETQRQDLSNAAIGLSASAEGIPRFAHQTYISGLTFMADVADTQIDYFSLPTADDLGLGERGTIGFSFITDESLLGAEFVFEHSPGDMLASGNGITAVAIGGILAAIAVPAYQDYTIRAQVAEGMTQAHSLRTELSAFYAENERFPDALEAEDFYRENVGQYAGPIAVEPDSGTIYVYFEGPSVNSNLSGMQLWLTPYDEEQDGSFEWYCESDIEYKHLPSSCR